MGYRQTIMISFMFIFISAFLFQSAFMWPEYCAWTVFIFLIPVFYRVVRFPIKHSFLVGMGWGVIFFSFHFIALFLVFYQKAQGSWRFAAPLFFMLYCALQAAMWFYVSYSMARGRSQNIQLALWGIGTWLYFYWFCNYSLWPCGREVGYCFGSPLLPLAQYPFMLKSLDILGAGGLIAVLIFIQILGALFFMTLKKRFLFFSLLCSLFFYVGKSGDTVENSPDYLSELCYVQPPPRTMTHPLEQAEEINARITKAVQLKPNARCILMPESSFTHCLNELNYVIELWGINALADDFLLCIGSYRSNTYNEYNSLYVIEKCRITKSYDKSFLMPFVEYLPSFCKKFEWIRNLFLRNTSEFSPNKNCRSGLTLTKNLHVVPHLCSDIYMEGVSDSDYAPHGQTPILLAVNDSWFSAQYAQNLMFLYAIYYAMLHRRDILYIGHRFGCWISHATGKTKLL